MPNVMKAWPKDGRPVDFENLASPLRRLLKQFYKLVPKVDPKINYTGYDADPHPACISKFSENLTPEAIQNHAEQNRDPVDIVLMGALWVGMEQGKRAHVPRVVGNELGNHSHFLIKLLDNLERETPAYQMVVEELVRVSKEMTRYRRLEYS